MNLKLFNENDRMYSGIQRPIYYIYIFFWKLSIFYKYFEDYNQKIFYIKQKSFNLSDPVEKLLLNINNFYEALNWVKDDNFRKLLVLSGNISEYDFEMYGWEEMWDYTITNYREASPNERYDNKVKYFFERWASWYVHGEKVEWELTNKEFYLLMQIYFWLYKEDELLKKGEEKEKKGYYNSVKDLNFFTWKNNELFEEYLKLKLMRQDTSWAFGWLKIEKIYDKDWDEMKQKEHIDTINKEFWEEVVVME